MAQKPLSKGKHGDVAAILNNSGVSAIRLNEITYTRTSGDAFAQPDQPARPAHPAKEKIVHDLLKNEPSADDGRIVIESVDDLLSGGKSKGIETLVEGISSKTSDESGATRKRVLA